jgi:hypothetical protein
MEQLGRLDPYRKELSKITRAKNVPSEWAVPDQCCRGSEIMARSFLYANREENH